MDIETKLQIFINSKIPHEISECISGVFEKDTDPEISFQLLRGLLTKLKKEHKALYSEYLDSDDIEAPETQIAQYRRENGL
jgi:hypothetical protein